MLTTDLSALKVIRRFLDDVNYAYMCQRLIPRMEVELFPDFAALQGTFKALYPIYRLLFTLFWQGHVADDAVLRRAFPPEIFDALIKSGLLVQDKRKHWHTPNIGLIPFEGLYLAVSLPLEYPTASTNTQEVYLGQEAIWLTKSLPATLMGSRVLDVKARSGVQGLVCAARGAAHVVALEESEEAVAAARFNVALNGFADRVEVRRSEGFSGLDADEKFDFVVASIPFLPGIPNGKPASASDLADGSRPLSEFFEHLPRIMAPNASGVVFCYALGGQFSIDFNQKVLLDLTKKHSLSVHAYVSDKIPLPNYINSTLERKLQQVSPDLSVEGRNQKIAGWYDNLRQQGVSTDFIYEQMIRFWNGRSEIGVTHMPIYNPLLTDPLVKLTTVAMLRG